MSSDAPHVQPHTGNSVSGDISTRVLKDMLRNAGYTTDRLEPLAGRLRQTSETVLHRFLTLTMQDPAR